MNTEAKIKIAGINPSPSKLARFGVLLGTTATTLVALPLFTGFLGETFFGIETVTSLFRWTGFSGAVGAVVYLTEKLFLIRNGTTGVFVTQDALASLVGSEKFNVAYGSGVHICYPWERRFKENYILIEDEATDFTFTVSRPDGALYGKGSFRLRPDPNNLIAFLQSVAAVRGEVEDLVIAQVQSFFKKEGTALKLLGQVTELNQYLETNLAPAVSKFQKWNGIIVSDATVAEIKPSDELQRTNSAVSEADAVARGTAMLLMKESPKAVAKAVKSGELTPADVREATRVFLHISGNAEGIDRKQYIFSLEGVSPEIATALGHALNNPAVTASIVANAQKGTGNVKEGKKKP